MERINVFETIEEGVNEPPLLSSESMLGVDELDASLVLDGSYVRLQTLQSAGDSVNWDVNYQEAAIYLEEGCNNDKFDYHPSGEKALSFYSIVHNRYFYLLDLLSASLLLSLVLIEKPAIAGLAAPEAVHASLELLALLILTIELKLKLKWMGSRYFLTHTRTLIKLFTLSIMIIEAIVVLIRRDSHFRVTRALRPVFLIDNHYCGGIRRVIRQILQSMPPIIDMLLLLFFFMLIFALLGFYLFSPNPDDPYFSTMEQSFINLFVLISTANYPDVMMPSYSKNRWNAIFFVVFLVIHLYFLTNLLLAVVYETFTRIEKEKFRKLLLHRRKACQAAFRLLVTPVSPSKLLFVHFRGLMKYYKPKISDLRILLMYKTLSSEKMKDSMTLEDFYKVYDIVGLQWQQKTSFIPWYAEVRFPMLRRFLDFIDVLVRSAQFEIFVSFVIVSSVIWQIVESSYYTSFDLEIIALKNSNACIVFITFFTLEMTLKLIGLGLINYFASGWNIFDAIVTIFSIIGLITEQFDKPFAFIFILRSIRLLKILELKESYSDIMRTFFFIMMRRFTSVFVIVFIIYYFFAVIAMEIFSPYSSELVNCCKNTTIEQYFSTTSNSYFYLNNFSDVAVTFVTLFELMVVNNWHILMEAFVILTNRWSRIYFMSFYIITNVVLSIVVAFVLEAFLFRINYRRKMGESIEKDMKVIYNVSVSNDEFDYYLSSDSRQHESFQIRSLGDLPEEKEVSFIGSCLRSKFSFNLKMYENEAKKWLQVAEAEEREQHRKRIEIKRQESGYDTHGSFTSSQTSKRRTTSCVY